MFEPISAQRYVFWILDIINSLITVSSTTLIFGSFHNHHIESMWAETMENIAKSLQESDADGNGMGDREEIKK